MKLIVKEKKKQARKDHYLKGQDLYSLDDLRDSKNFEEIPDEVVPLMDGYTKTQKGLAKAITGHKLSKIIKKKQKKDKI